VCSLWTARIQRKAVRRFTSLIIMITGIVVLACMAAASSARSIRGQHALQASGDVISLSAEDLAKKSKKNIAKNTARRELFLEVDSEKKVGTIKYK